MGVFDIILAALLGYGIYNGWKNGLFVELASLVALVIGIYFSLKFSYIVRAYLENNVSWSAKYVQIAAFGITFIGTVVSIHLLAKTFTKLANFAHLGWLNKLGGAGFSVLKTVLALSILFNLFQKININNMIASQKSLDSSVFYNPIQEVSKFIYPTLEDWYNEFKTKTAETNNQH
jgi:membrane protein required for colicin V production